MSTTASRTFELGVYSAVSWLLQHEIRILSCKFFSYHGATQARLEEEKQHVFWILQSAFPKLVLSLSLDGSQGWICQKCSASISIDKSSSRCWIYQSKCNSFVGFLLITMLVSRIFTQLLVHQKWNQISQLKRSGESTVDCGSGCRSRQCTEEVILTPCEMCLISWMTRKVTAQVLRL